jgi:hypothetical protein
LFWWQGESGGFEDSYLDDFETVQTRFRNLGGMSYTTPLTVFGVTPSSRGLEDRYDETNFALQRLVSYRKAYRTFVPTYNLGDNGLWEDTVHLNGEGYNAIGKIAVNLMGSGGGDIFGSNPEPSNVPDAFSNHIGNGKYRVEATTLNLPLSSAGMLEKEIYNPNFATLTYTQATTGLRYRASRKAGVWGNWYIISGVLRTVLTTDQTATAGTDYTIPWSELSSEFDTLYTGSRFYAQRGYWNIAASARVSSGLTTGEVVTLQLYDEISSSILCSQEVKDSKQVFLSTNLFLNGTEQIIVRIRFSGSGSRTIQGGGKVTYFNASAVF